MVDPTPYPPLDVTIVAGDETFKLSGAGSLEKFMAGRLGVRVVNGRPLWWSWPSPPDVTGMVEGVIHDD